MVLRPCLLPDMERTKRQQTEHLGRSLKKNQLARSDKTMVGPRPHLFRSKTRPRTLDLYEVFCGVLYVLKSGCQWRMLPSDFPKWCSVHAYFQIWSERKDNKPSTLEEVLKKISWRGPTKQWSDQDHIFSDRKLGRERSICMKSSVEYSTS